MMAPAIASANSKARKAGIANVIRSGIGAAAQRREDSIRKHSCELGVYTRAETRASGASAPGQVRADSVRCVSALDSRGARDFLLWYRRLSAASRSSGAETPSLG